MYQIRFLGTSVRFTGSLLRSENQSAAYLLRRTTPTKHKSLSDNGLPVNQKLYILVFHFWNVFNKPFKFWSVHRSQEKEKVPTHRSELNNP